MLITSVNLSTLPFMGSCDSTRAQMASKQMAQAITHENCEIPYVISNEYRNLSETSTLGLCIAKDDGQVIFNNNELIIIYYDNLTEIKSYKVPLYQKTTGYYSSKLTFALNQNSKFKKGDIIYSYDNFKNGIPSFGYNVMTAYLAGFGMNHEDSLILSESVLNKAKIRLSEKVYIPVYDYTILLPAYKHVENSLIYFPNIGQKITGNIVCSVLKPSTLDGQESNQTIKNKMTRFYNSLSISDLLNMSNETVQNIKIEGVKTKVTDGVVTGINIHKLRTKPGQLIDPRFQKCLDDLINIYCEQSIITTFNDLQHKVNQEYAKQVIKNYIMYVSDNTAASATYLKQANYLIELEITREDSSIKGDKFCNRFAGKGVVSLALPDEFRPTAMNCNKPVDCIFNSFGVYSRMNTSQLIEAVVSKEIMLSEERILNNPTTCISELTKINNDVIKHFNSVQYYKDVDNLIKQMTNDPTLVDEFVDDVRENGMFIEAPSFSELDIKQLIAKNTSHIENIKIEKKTLLYMKDKLNFNLNFTINGDVVIKNKLCAPIYMMKLYKLATEIISARDLGKCKFITKQPMKGKSQGAAKRLGQMEIEGIISHGCLKSLRELLTIKSDHVDEKRKMLKDLINTGEYHIDTESEFQGETKKVVNTLIQFLKD